MSDEKGYQGWKNYETWCVALWIDNDEGLYDHFRDMAKDSDIDYLADHIKDMIDDCNPLNDTANLYTDLLNAALSEVDWFEIAEHYKEDDEE